MRHYAPSASRFARCVATFLALQLALGFWWAPAAAPETFFVSPGGDDGTGNGTAGSPWRTISRALTEPPGTGDIIDVASGTYDTAAGETFPLYLIDGVHLRGAGRDVTTIEVPNGTPAFENENTPLASTTTLSGFTVQSDATNSSTASSPLMRLDQEEALTESDQVMAPTIRDNRFRRGRGAIYSKQAHESLAPTYAPLIRGNTFSEVSALDVETTMFTTVLWNTAFTETIGILTITSTFVSSTPAILVEADEASELGGRIAPTIEGNTFSDVNAIQVDIDAEHHESLEVDLKVLENSATASAFAGLLDFFGFELSQEGETTSAVTVKTLARGNTLRGIEEAFAFSVEAETDAALDATITISGNVHEEAAGKLLDWDQTSFGDLETNIKLLVSGNTVTFSESEGESGMNISLTEADGFDDEDSFNIQVSILNNRMTGLGEDAEEVDGINVTFDDMELSSGRGGEIDVLIAGNRVRGFETGVDVEMSDLTGENIAGSVRLLGNHATEGRNGLEMSLTDLGEIAGSFPFEVRDNHLSANEHWGLRVGLDDAGDKFVEFACNRVVGNDTDPATTGGEEGFQGGGVLVEQPDEEESPEDPDGEAAVFGDPGEELGQNNVFSGNTENGGFDFYDFSSEEIRARGNFWGTTVEEDIEENLFDEIDESSRGRVLHDSALAAAPSVNVTVTLDDEVISTDPTVIEYTATITGAGDCGAAGGAFSAAIPSNGDIVEGSVMVSPEGSAAVFGEDPIDVQVGHIGSGDEIIVTWQVQIDPDETQVETRGTVSTPQTGPVDSEDPDGGGPTVTLLQALEAIPTLGPFGVALLAALLSLAAFAVLRRGYSVAALLLVSSLLVVGGARAVQQRAEVEVRPAAPDAPRRVAEARPAAPPEALVAKGKHATRITGGARVPGRLGRMTLADGSIFEFSREDFELKDKRSQELRSAMKSLRQERRKSGTVSAASSAAVRSWRQQARAGGGMPVVLEIKTDKDDPTRVRKVKVELHDDFAAAEAAATAATREPVAR